MNWQPVKLQLSVDTRVKVNNEAFSDLYELCEAVGIYPADPNQLLAMRGTIVDCWAHPDSEYQYSVAFDGIDDEWSFKEGGLVKVNG